jgi:hypothetical protein
MLGAVYGESVPPVIYSTCLAAPRFQDAEVHLALMPRAVAARRSVYL